MANGKRRKLNWRSVCASLLAPGFILALIFVVLMKGFLPADYAVKSAVRGYLKKNLNDPNFEEVWWGPAYPLDSDGGYKITLSYRARNPFNAWILKTEHFYVKGNRVEVIPPDEVEP